MDARVVIKDVIRLLASLLFFLALFTSSNMLCFRMWGGKSEIGYRC